MCFSMHQYFRFVRSPMELWRIWACTLLKQTTLRGRSWPKILLVGAPCRLQTTSQRRKRSPCLWRSCWLWKGVVPIWTWMRLPWPSVTNVGKNTFPTKSGSIFRQSLFAYFCPISSIISFRGAWISGTLQHLIQSFENWSPKGILKECLPIIRVATKMRTTQIWTFWARAKPNTSFPLQTWSWGQMRVGKYPHPPPPLPRGHHPQSWDAWRGWWKIVLHHIQLQQVLPSVLNQSKHTLLMALVCDFNTIQIVLMELKLILHKQNSTHGSGF